MTNVIGPLESDKQKLCPITFQVFPSLCSRPDNLKKMNEFENEFKTQSVRKQHVLVSISFFFFFLSASLPAPGPEVRLALEEDWPRQNNKI